MAFVTGRIGSKEEVCSRVQNERHTFVSGNSFDCTNTRCLCGDRVQTLALHHSVFEIDPDGTGTDDLANVLGTLIGICCMAAFEIPDDGQASTGGCGMNC